MPRATTALYKGKRINVEEALTLPQSERIHMHCIDCGQPVNPHKASKPGKKPNAAHFEHYQAGGGRNAKCKLSDPARS